MCTGVCPGHLGSFIAVLQHNPGLLFQPLAKIETFYFLMSHLGFTEILKGSPTLFFFAVESRPCPGGLVFPGKDGVEPASAAVSSIP